MNRISVFAFLIGGILCAQNAVSSSIDEQRENIIRYSRLGDVQLVEGTKQLADLYRSTHDYKVRDDLITLLVRQNQFKEALSVCSHCRLDELSENELEVLAKAARNERQFDQSLSFYHQLTRVASENPNGLLGLALVSTDISHFENSQKYLSQYKRKFGIDKEYEQANTYLLDSSEPLTSQLHRLSNNLAKNPDDVESAKKLYRVAAQLNISPLQEKLISDYPALFNETDKLWLLHENAVRAVKNTPSRQALRASYSTLEKTYNEAPEHHPIKRQSLYDMTVIASKLNNTHYIEKNYIRLQKSEQPIPNYVKESYADYLLASGSPFSALELYSEIEQSYLVQKQKAPFSLQLKIVNALSDAAMFSEAQRYLESEIAEPSLYVMDFTHSRKIENPDYDSYFASKVNLQAWKGNLSGAMQLLDERLSVTPGDGWIMLTKAELESARERSDDALNWIEKAQEFLSGEPTWVDVTKANVALSVNNLRAASHIVNNWSQEQKENLTSFLERYEQAKSARLVASGGISHRTSPAGENESNQEYYLYSPKTDEGHNVFVHYLTTKSPDDGLKFEQQRLGAGIEANFYPVIITTEAGKGIRLNDKAYFSTNIQYRLNQHWNFNVRGSLNSINTPVKALYQDTYAKDFGFSVGYKYSNRFELGSHVSVMKFDDGNLRKDLSIWSNFNLFKHNRWNLDGSLFASYERNKDIPEAYYYNPSKSRSAEGNLDLSYFQPFNHRITLTHHLKGGAGYYWQDNFESSEIWSIAYGHEWRLGKGLSISYDIGRKRSIYDGDPEFNNFINLGLSVSF
ncbi:poly-beta-1,6 N-acetyl-D-glucosamine export porin PgaA [Actinobacillus succinogenes]|uniref:PgaA membrane beta barrel domain-containing protein n=1 Tax=Actinobacillus succinogenes (strain ATCC 55618 / DSM 22257 / CCUG 43843 / 130Z) TaxID=339671 RepID=A6VMM8_ACTSZ|nr:poly-beta-1,6 N-acetyl-D-glucosamine export porin PgaA [Actinobacillus succinogenes]ABR74225.1 conserved hypothetical protein [Actinobacillus succinogenes 130Z]PHI39346.1 poly-beta-1,6 N-acetyl-D-glucosamine export porin PgaA [Actinobacillus succinogenes]